MKQQTHFTYDSVAALLADIPAAPLKPENAYIYDELGGMGHGWICADRPHIRSLADAERALAEPLFPEGVARIEDLAAQIEAPAPVSLRRRVTRGDHGDELDQQRVWNGQLDTAWTRAARQATVGASRVHIGVSAGAPSSVSSAVVAWRGAAALALGDVLEAAGYTVAIVALRRADAHVRYGQEYATSVDVTVKAEGEPLDVHKAASLIGSTLLFRGVLLKHTIANSLVQLTGAVSGTNYAKQDAPARPPGFDFACVATSAIVDAKTASVWLAAQVAALNTLNQ